MKIKKYNVFGQDYIEKKSSTSYKKSQAKFKKKLNNFSSIKIANQSNIKALINKKIKKLNSNNNSKSPRCITKFENLSRNRNFEINNNSERRQKTLINIDKIKNKFKKTIIIDEKGNNNLNIKRKYFTENTSQKMILSNIKKNKQKYSINKIIENSQKNKNDIFRNNIVKNLLKFYTNNNDTNNTITEKNSLFVNSNSNLNNDENNKKYNNETIKILNKKRNKQAKISNINYYKIKQNNIIKSYFNAKKKKTISPNNNNYYNFLKNIPKINNYIVNNKENIQNNEFNSSQLLSFLESSLHDEFYQMLLKKSIKENNNEESINLSKSISEFGGIKNDKVIYKFENIIHLPMKNK